MLALFCSDSPFSKWLYFYEIYFQELESPLEVTFLAFFPLTSQNALMKYFSDILEGLFHLFDISPPSPDIISDLIELCVKKFSTSKSVGYEKIEAGQLEIGDFVQIIQENHTICKYADAILSLCTPPQVCGQSFLICLLLLL
jgi:hypothetical protein